MTKFYESAETKTHGLLLAEQGRLTETRSKLSQSVLASTEAEASTTRALNDIEKAFIHGQATTQQIEKARQEAGSANDKLTADQRMLKLADDALKEISAEIQQAEQRLIIAKRDYVLSEKARIGESLNADAKIRAQLMEAYAAMLSNPQGFNGDWKLFVISIFTGAPSQIEIDNAIAAFSQKHGIDM